MEKISLRLLKSISVMTVLCGSVLFAADTTPSSEPNDAQIAEIVMTANYSEIAVSRLAAMSTNKEVKAFAKDMITVHSNSNADIRKLTTKLNLKLANSQLSENLKIEEQKNLNDLKNLKGAELDREYVDIIVKAHDELLKLFDTTLIPNIKNSELESLMMQTRATVIAHLDHAKRIQAAIEK